MQKEYSTQNGCTVRTDLIPLFRKTGLTGFSQFMDCKGDLISKKRGRTVFKVSIGGLDFFLKKNRINIKELLKNIAHLRVNYPGAKQEMEAVSALTEAGIKTVRPVAFGEKRRLGVEFASFLMTESLSGYRSLEEIIMNHQDPFHPGNTLVKKWDLIERTAHLANSLLDNANIR